MNLKAKLLHDAASKPVRRAIQYDGFALGPSGGDDVMRPDEEGDCVMFCEAYELRRTPVQVRVQILAGTARADALRLLRKIGAWIERDERSLLPGESEFNSAELSEARQVAELTGKVDVPDVARVLRVVRHLIGERPTLTIDDLPF